MAKRIFDFKAIQKNLPGTFANTALVMGGMIASKKFLDPNEILKDQEPDSMLVKNFPLIKLVLGLVGVAASSGMKSMGNGINLLGSFSMGVALEGGITYIRQVTSKESEDGSIEYLYDPIGNVQTLKSTAAVGGGVQNPRITSAVGSAVGGMGVVDAEEITVLSEDEASDDL